MIRSVRRLAVVLGATTLGLVALAAPASAHTEAEATAADAGRTAVTLTFEHGCDDAPTTTFRAQLPDGATDVQPHPVDGWTTSVADGQVAWTGGSIAGTGSFTLELVLAQPVGSTVAMPAIQECPGGLEEAWIQQPDASGAEPEMPAPTFVVPANSTTPTTAAAASTTTSEAGPTTTVRMNVEQTPITQEGSETNTSGLVVFLVVVAVIVIGAGLLFLRYRRRAPR
jgi:uncharacterized protein YcnI